DEIEKHAGVQFDPEIVEIFMKKVVSKLPDKDSEQPVKTYPLPSKREN
ncbi:MAG: hypothetical protein GTN76_10960, partial [Candidatus Aenigmarchaeota archaeon]|nr:hypothetical protein [Candidatus Aenigmarchaeota archaeon]